MNNKKFYFLGILGVVVAGVVIFGLWYQGIFGQSKHGLMAAVKDRPDLVAITDQIKKDEQVIKEDPEKVSAYLALGLNWKSLGELAPRRQRDFYEQSLKIYNEGIERFGSKNILFYLNHGKVAEIVEDYARAEQDYRQVIAISPGDESGYISLATLYDYKMHKSKEEILAVFKQGIEKLFNPIALVAARGSYLRRVGDNRAALKDYEVLVENLPSNGYQKIVEELKEKIAAES